MKQHITKEQCMELTKKQAEYLLDWYLDSFDRLYGDTVVHEYLPEEDMLHHGNFDEEREFEKADYMGKIKNYEGEIRPILNIGQMIEFLGENMYQINLGTNGLAWAMLTKGGEQITAYELCDALWEAVKHKLNHPQEDE